MIFSLGNKKPTSQGKTSSLSHLNVPALTGRLDASYDQAIKFFSNNVCSKNQEERKNIYKDTLKLLNIALEAKHSLSFFPMHHEDKKDPIAQYLLLLRDTIQAAYALIAHEMIIFQEEKQLSNFIDNEISSQLKSTDEIFTNSELSICQSTTELIQKAAPAINKYRDRIQKGFSQDELVRYKKSFNEFLSIYNNIKPIDEKNRFLTFLIAYIFIFPLMNRLHFIFSKAIIVDLESPIFLISLTNYKNFDRL